MSNKVKRLADNFSNYVRVPWRDDAAALQRVIFCVYDENEELRLRARIDEFELATRETGHDWHLFDLTNTFANWLAAQRYAESYFKKPELISTVLPKYQSHIVSSFEKFLSDSQADENSVVALQGVGSLFGLTKVKGIVDQLAPLVKGRLVVFFPGSYENNNYRLLDAYDGWGYLAVPITADKDH
ncbi:MAG: DUF1788 domain-containing protein [Opitutales bacterium]|nr:DUF1788 domain-containing protein [Opitutales bacterium]